MDPSLRGGRGGGLGGAPSGVAPLPPSNARGDRRAHRGGAEDPSDVGPAEAPRAARAPNDLWSTDFKGQSHTRNGTWCHPLTVADLYSHDLVEIRGLPTTRTEGVRPAFERLFREVGLPHAILNDNGAHERMHRTLKAETAIRPPETKGLSSSVLTAFDASTTRRVPTKRWACNAPRADGVPRNALSPTHSPNPNTPRATPTAWSVAVARSA